MKDWPMIHKIKAMHDGGEGLSKSEIARQLGICRNTVKKYIEMDEEEVTRRLKNKKRKKSLDKHREYIVELLKRYPKLSSVKVRRKLDSLGLKIEVCDRTLRNYVNQLRKEIPVKQQRYYEPVLDMVAGVQCQVDAGELRDVSIDGETRTVYFVVFVLSYSRKMFVCHSLKAINTEFFIQSHDLAFRYFGGMPRECVYDQSSLVCIKEEFREVWFNNAFYQYATTAGFEIRVCEGYDPESKGKVEAGVKYVKNNFFYGEEFRDEEDLGANLLHWLNQTANSRLHGSTQKVPSEVFDQEEKARLKSYHSPSPLYPAPYGVLRTVDKTSLISFKSVKYSVPMIYQQSTVLLKVEPNRVFIHDPHTGEEIANHPLGQRKGEIVKNRHHYRDWETKIESYEQKIIERLGNDTGSQVCALLKETSPKIYKDQLYGLMQVLRPWEEKENLRQAFLPLVERSQLKVSFIKTYLNAFYSSRQREEPSPPSTENTEDDLRSYASLSENLSAREVPHALS